MVAADGNTRFDSGRGTGAQAPDDANHIVPSPTGLAPTNQPRETATMRVKLHRNTSDKRFGTATLPRRQRFVWLGPVFVHVIRKGA